MFTPWATYPNSDLQDKSSQPQVYKFSANPQQSAASPGALHSKKDLPLKQRKDAAMEMRLGRP
uniref:Uncharacterized protein n=1 Tax=Physcomitrium patens TaxID=3218 RepID=A0A2K1J934_PHYPA|nr:hypothetical protein PHYPA_021140 [Physcomitrium patens]